jgi:hypothetical protein
MMRRTQAFISIQQSAEDPAGDGCKQLEALLLRLDKHTVG